MLKDNLLRAYSKVAIEFSKLSECSNLKVGAIAVKNDTILAHGWNGTPSGYHTNTCELPTGETNPHVLHAEENIIAKMARSTESLQGATIICTHSPCDSCAKLLAQIGIAEFLYLEEYRNQSGLHTLRELNVKVEKIE